MNAPMPTITTSVRTMPDAPIFIASGTSIALRAGVALAGVINEAETSIDMESATPGTDYAIRLKAGRLVAEPCTGDFPADAIGGFHVAPGGNAQGIAGGDAAPAINPCSIWDVGFRPACPDPRGMALVEFAGRRFWCDIYLLGVDHMSNGTSRSGVETADGRSLPQAIGGKGRAKTLDYEAAKSILLHHGKGLLSAEEFFAAAYGVTERSSAKGDPNTTGLDAPRTSRFGIMQATGNLWVWGTDGHPDDPRPSLFGGSWINGGDAGSRCAALGVWPDFSYGYLSARGRCDHAA